MTNHARPSSWTAIVLGLILTLALAACGGSASPAASGGTATEAPGGGTGSQESAAPSEDAGAAIDENAAALLANLDSYRFQVKMATTGVEAGVVSGGDVVMNGIVIFRPEKAMSFEMTTSDAGADEALRFVVVGSKTWMDFGAGLMEVPNDGTQDDMFASFTPEELFGSSFSGYTDGLHKVGDEHKNGVDTAHFAADETTLAGFGLMYGFEGTWSMDVWIAKDGGYVVSSVLQGVATAGPESGSFLMSLDITNINDPSNKVETPS